MYDRTKKQSLLKLAMVVFLATTGAHAENYDISQYNNGGLNAQQLQDARNNLTNSGNGSGLYNTNAYGGYDTPMVNPITGRPATDLSNYSGLVAGGMQNARNAQGEVPKLSENTKNMDHADNNNQSGGQANSGAGAAAAAGAVMIAQGSAMVASPIIPVAVAGANLIAMGITELAQSAASGGASKDNYKNKDTLKSTSNDVGKQTGPSKVDYDSALTPEAKKVLSEHNIDPSDYINRAARGQLGNENDIAKQFGINDATDEQMREAKGLLDDNLNNVFGQEKTSLTLDESEKNKTEAQPGSGATTSGGVAAYQPNTGKASSTSGAPPAHSADSESAYAGNSARSGASFTPVPPTVPMDGQTWNSLLGQLGIPGDAAPWEKKAMVEDKLGAVGIELPRRGTNIFQKASMRYKKYNEWRKAKNVAAR